MRRGEEDTGACSHVGPDDELRQNWVCPRHAALWTWFQARAHDPVKVRYPLAAARRLDAAAQRVAEIEELRSDLEGLADQALALRRTVFRLVGAVESGDRLLAGR